MGLSARDLGGMQSNHDSLALCLGALCLGAYVYIYSISFICALLSLYHYKLSFYQKHHPVGPLVVFSIKFAHVKGISYHMDNS